MSIILTALVAGAAAGGSDAASAAVRDGYAALRRRLTRVAGDPETRAALEANDAAPGGNVAEIRAALSRAQAADDEELRTTAAELLTRLPSDRIEQARGRITVTDAQGVQIGDHNIQSNTFG
ncbi:RIP homotypic interaction motif-containing protein [Nocardia beijingensis]|uniref:RIP homotypic interaction motif-containing protein n=1 Tax=Nocardia beijingensis TaxID=95162 RepID=UPI00344D802B